MLSENLVVPLQRFPATAASQSGDRAAAKSWEVMVAEGDGMCFCRLFLLVEAVEVVDFVRSTSGSFSTGCFFASVVPWSSLMDDFLRLFVLTTLHVQAWYVRMYMVCFRSALATPTEEAGRHRTSANFPGSRVEPGHTGTCSSVEFVLSRKTCVVVQQNHHV